VLAGEGYRIKNIGLGSRASEPAGRTANAKSGVWGQGNMFTQLHFVEGYTTVRLAQASQPQYN
jgi:hypothetical protein